MNLSVCGDLRFFRHVAHRSCAFWVFNICLAHMQSDAGCPLAPTLLQDKANATLRSETLRETTCNAIIINGGVREPSKMPKTFAMTDASDTVQILVACAMQGIRFSSINCLR